MKTCLFDYGRALGITTEYFFNSCADWCIQTCSASTKSMKTGTLMLLSLSGKVKAESDKTSRYSLKLITKFAYLEIPHNLHLFFQV